MTVVATARENSSIDQFWIFAITVGCSLGSGSGTAGEIVELMVDSDVSSLVRADAPMSQQLSFRKLEPADVHSDTTVFVSWTSASLRDRFG